MLSLWLSLLRRLTLALLSSSVHLRGVVLSLWLSLSKKIKPRLALLLKWMKCSLFVFLALRRLTLALLSSSVHLRGAVISLAFSF